MIRKTISATVVLIALMSSGRGPVSANNPQQRIGNPSPSPDVIFGYASEPSDEVREEFHQTYPLAANGRVSLENMNGGVQIKVWDRPAVQLDAVKRAYRRERLAEARIDVNSSEENIRIKTDYPDENQRFNSDEKGRYDNPAIVDYVLTVPRQAVLESIELINGPIGIDGVEGSVKASSINGPVTARGLLGEAKLSTINGPLQATFTRLDDSKPISLDSINGPVTLIIPSDSNAMVRASTVHGDISNDFGLEVKHGEYVGHDLAGQIGTGGPRIKLGNVNGPIRIAHSQDGRKLSSATSLSLDNMKLRRESTKVIKDKIKKESVDAMTESIASEVASEVAAATASATTAEVKRAQLDSARIARRQVDVALREAQREVAQAQQEIQREVEAQVREQTREQVRAARGAGRGVGSGTGRSSGVGTSDGLRYTTQESKTFSVSGTPRVNIGTFDGPVTVHGWDKSEVMFTAIKRADDEEELKQLSVRSEQQGSTISIVAHSEEQNGSVQLDVYVPRRSSLHVSSDDGHLNLEGVSGDITLRTGDGAIEVNGGSGQLDVNTGDGHIRVMAFEGQVEARTGDGAISLDGNFNALSARTGDGSISLTVPAGSNFTIETNADDNVSNEGLTIAEDIAPSKRVKRWKVGAGGNVFVLNTGDGRIVLRSR
jgi:DUF4097 and DUF4098 domain-containing protein YvlB